MATRHAEPRQILPHTWLVTGRYSAALLSGPPTSNAYVIRDDDTLYVVDTGRDAASRRGILDTISEERRRRAVRRVVLLLTHGHFDHSGNVGLVLDDRMVGVEWEFLLPEVEVPQLDSVGDLIRDLDAIGRHTNIVATMAEALPVLAPTMQLVSRLPTPLRHRTIRAIVSRAIGTDQALSGDAVLLHVADTVERSFGSVTLRGWDVGPFFAIHDGAHTPGHTCFYDRRTGLVLTGDATIEINPAFGYSSMNGLAGITADLATMAREGYVEHVADGHRSRESFATIEQAFHVKPLHPTQTHDVIHGAEDSAAFLGFFSGYYRDLVDEVHAAHARIGRATLAEITAELRRSTNRSVQFKNAMVYAGAPSRMTVLVAQVLSEAGAAPVPGRGTPRFDPVGSPPSA